MQLDKASIRQLNPERRSVPEQPDRTAGSAPRARLVSIEVAAQLLGIGRTTVYDLVNRGELRATKIGRRTLLAVEDIDVFVDRKLASA